MIALAALALNFVVPGPTGAAGASYSVRSTLPLGENESGVYAAWGGTDEADLGPTVEFPIPLSEALPATNVTFISAGESYNATCPGPGSATTGQLCVHEVADGDRDYETIFSPATAYAGASQYGFSIWFVATGSDSYSYGTWTVSAP